MISKFFTVVLMLMMCSVKLCSQTGPVKHFSLRKEAADIVPDSLGTSYVYSTTFEVPDTLLLSTASFVLKATDTDSVLSRQTFSLPAEDGVYPTPNSVNGLLKDKTIYFILLGTFKSLTPIRLVADFTDVRNVRYMHILTNE